MSKLYLSDIECLVEVRDVEKQGDVVYQETFPIKLDLRRSVDPAILRTWNSDDCARFAIQNMVEGFIVPWLTQIPEFKTK